MSLVSSISPESNMKLRPDREQILVQRLLKSIEEISIQVEPRSVINFYIALKSKALAILAGPPQTGKRDVISCFAHALMGEPLQFQMMIGHPFWASGSENVALFTESQARYNTEKILGLIETARQPENSRRIYLACLTGISPCELETYFSSAASHDRRGKLGRLPHMHFGGSAQFPPNLVLLGTIDTPSPGLWQLPGGSNTALIYWEGGKQAKQINSLHQRSGIRYQSEFLQDSIRSLRPARQKLRRVLGWGLRGLSPLIRCIELHEKIGISIPVNVTSDALIYLANSWSRDDVGLFAMSPSENLKVALDYAFVQVILPNAFQGAGRLIDRPGELDDLLVEQFPLAFGLLNQYRNDSNNLPFRDCKSIDPICGMEVSPRYSAEQAQFQGRMYYFCSQGCRYAFDKDPSRYVGN